MNVDGDLSLGHNLSLWREILFSSGSMLGEDHAHSWFDCFGLWNVGSGHC